MIRKFKYDDKWLGNIRWYEGVVDVCDNAMRVAPLGLNMLLRWARISWMSMKFGIPVIKPVDVRNWPQAGLLAMPKETQEKMKEIIDEAHKQIGDCDHGEEWKGDN